MDNGENDKILGLVQTYYKDPASREKILRYFIKNLNDEVESQCKLVKAKLTRREKDSEAVYAILSTFETITDGRTESKTLKETFRYFLGRGLKNSCPTRKNHIDVTTISIADPSLNPEELYELKEQIEHVKNFVKSRYGKEELDLFVMHYMDGRSFVELADLFSLSDSAVAKRLQRTFARVQKYMKRITNEQN